MSAWTQLFGPGPALLLLIVLLVPQTAVAAPFEHDTTDIEYYPVADSTGCYYNFQHYDEGDRIITNEPCLNCTCHNRMLMCYLRVCPFTKAIGQDCKVEKKADQCCPVITCPEVPVQLLPSTTQSSTAVGHLDAYGCSIDGLFYADGARVPSDPNKPCELCYCIRNKTACVMQQCTLEVEGCKPVYQEGVCCPVRYNCEHPDYNLLETTTKRLLTTTALPTTTLSGPSDCIYNNDVYADGALIISDKRCERCYCMKGDIVCAVQKCNPTPLDKVNCTALPPKEGQCCPDSYECDYMIEEELTTGYSYTTPPSEKLDESTTLKPKVESKPEEEIGVTPPVSQEENEITPEIGEETATPSVEKEGEVTVLPSEAEKEHPQVPEKESTSETGVTPSLDEAAHGTEIPEQEKEKPIEQEQVTGVPETLTSKPEEQPEIPDEQLNEIPEEHEIVTAGPHIPGIVHDDQHEEEEHEGGSGEEHPEVTESVEMGTKVPETATPHVTEGKVPEITYADTVPPVHVTEAQRGEGQPTEISQEPLETVPPVHVTEAQPGEGQPTEIAQEPADTVPPIHVTEAEPAEGQPTEISQEPVTEEKQEVTEEPRVPGVPEVMVTEQHEDMTEVPQEAVQVPVDESEVIPSTEITEKPETEGEGTEVPHVATDRPEYSPAEEGTEVPEEYVTQPEKDIEPAVTEIAQKPETETGEKGTEAPQSETEGGEEPQHVPVEEGEGEPEEEKQPELPPGQVTTEGKQDITEHPHIIQHVTEMAPEIGTGLPHEMEIFTEPGKAVETPQEPITEEEKVTEISQVPVTEEPQVEVTHVPSGQTPKEEEVREPTTGRPSDESKLTEAPKHTETEVPETETSVPPHIPVQEGEPTELPESDMGAEGEKIPGLPQEPVVEEETSEKPQEQEEVGEKLTETPHRDVTEVPELPEDKGTELPEEYGTKAPAGEPGYTELPKEHVTVLPVGEEEATEVSKESVTELTKEESTELPKDHIEGEKGSEIPKEHVTELPKEHVPEGESTEHPKEPESQEIPEQIITEGPTEEKTELPQEETTDEHLKVTELPQQPITEGQVPYEKETEIPPIHVTEAQIPKETEIPKEHVPGEEKSTEAPQDYVTQVPDKEPELPLEHVTHKPESQGTELPGEFTTEKHIDEVITEVPQELPKGTIPPESQVVEECDTEGEGCKMPASPASEEGKTTETVPHSTEIPKEHVTEQPQAPVSTEHPEKPDYVGEGKLDETTKYAEEPSPVEGEVPEQYPVEHDHLPEVPEQETEESISPVTEKGVEKPEGETVTPVEKETGKPQEITPSLVGEEQTETEAEKVTEVPSKEPEISTEKRTPETDLGTKLPEEPSVTTAKYVPEKEVGTELPQTTGETEEHVPSKEMELTTIKSIPQEESTGLPQEPVEGELTEHVPVEEGAATTAKYTPEKGESTVLPEQPSKGTEPEAPVTEISEGEGTEKAQEPEIEEEGKSTEKAHVGAETPVTEVPSLPAEPEVTEQVPSEEHTEESSEKVAGEISTSTPTEEKEPSGQVTELPTGKPPLHDGMEPSAVPEEEQEEEEHGIPGEGSCLVDGQTYKNNSNVPPINHCQVSCKCISSILQCESVTCTPPPSNLQHCMPVFPGPDSCCATYSCTVPGVTSMESDSHKIETTTKETIPGAIDVNVVIPSEEGTVRPEGTTSAGRDSTELPEFSLPEEHVSQIPVHPEHGTELPIETSEIPEEHVPGKPVEHIPGTETPVEIVTPVESGKVTIPEQETTEAAIEAVTMKELEQPVTKPVQEGTTFKPSLEEESHTMEYPKESVQDETHPQVDEGLPDEEENEIIDHTEPYGISPHLPGKDVEHPEVVTEVNTPDVTESQPAEPETLPESAKGDMTEASVSKETVKEVPSEYTTQKPSKLPEESAVTGEIPETVTEGEKEIPGHIPVGVSVEPITESEPERVTEVKHIETTPESVTSGIKEKVPETDESVTTESELKITSPGIISEGQEKITTESVKEVPESGTEPVKEYVPEQVTESEGVKEVPVVPVDTEKPSVSEGETVKPSVPEEGVTEGTVTMEPAISEGITETQETVKPSVPEVATEAPEGIKVGVPEGVTESEGAVKPEVPEGVTESAKTEKPSYPEGITEIPEVMKPGAPESVTEIEEAEKPSSPEGVTETVKPGVPESVTEIPEGMKADVPESATETEGETEVHGTMEPEVSQGITETAETAKPSVPGSVTEIPEGTKADVPESVTETEGAVKPEVPEAVTETEGVVEPEVPEGVTESAETAKPSISEDITEIPEGIKPGAPESVTETEGAVKPSVPEGVTDTPEDMKPGVPEGVTETPEGIKPEISESVTETGETVKPSISEGVTETPEDMKPGVPEGVTETEVAVKPSVPEGMPEIPGTVEPVVAEEVTEVPEGVKSDTPEGVTQDPGTTKPSGEEGQTEISEGAKPSVDETETEIPEGVKPSVPEAVTEIQETVKPGVPVDVTEVPEPMKPSVTEPQEQLPHFDESDHTPAQQEEETTSKYKPEEHITEPHAPTEIPEKVTTKPEEEKQETEGEILEAVTEAGVTEKMPESISHVTEKTEEGKLPEHDESITHIPQVPEKVTEETPSEEGKPSHKEPEITVSPDHALEEPKVTTGLPEHVLPEEGRVTETPKGEIVTEKLPEETATEGEAEEPKETEKEGKHTTPQYVSEGSTLAPEHVPGTVSFEGQGTTVYPVPEGSTLTVGLPEVEKAEKHTPSQEQPEIGTSAPEHVPAESESGTTPSPGYVPEGSTPSKDLLESTEKEVEPSVSESTTLPAKETSKPSRPFVYIPPIDESQLPEHDETAEEEETPAVQTTPGYVPESSSGIPVHVKPDSERTTISPVVTDEEVSETAVKVTDHVPEQALPESEGTTPTPGGEQVSEDTEKGAETPKPEPEVPKVTVAPAEQGEAGEITTEPIVTVTPISGEHITEKTSEGTEKGIPQVPTEVPLPEKTEKPKEEEPVTEEEKEVTQGVSIVTAQPSHPEEQTPPSVEGEVKSTELPSQKPEEGVTEYVSPISTEKPSGVFTTAPVEGVTETPRPSIPGEGEELPVEAQKPEEAFTSPTLTPTPRPDVVSTELFTSGPSEEITTKKSIPGELSTSATSKPVTSPTTPTSKHPSHDVTEEPEYPSQVDEEEYDEDQGAFGPGTCRYGGKVYVSAQQIPRDDPCDFCFCFRSDIICLQQSCPPPIPRCHEEPIRGFCCPRYECPVNMATSVNITTTTTTTTTTLPPHFLSHAYKGRAHKSGCQIQGRAYHVGEEIKSASGPCLHCTCGGNGQMKCDPKACSPEPMLRQMIAAAESRRRR